MLADSICFFLDSYLIPTFSSKAACKHVHLNICSRHDNTLENLCTRTAQSSRGVRSRRVHKIYYFGLL